MPGFDEEGFPFVAWARKNSIALINMGKASWLDPLVEFETSCRNPQQAFFFRKEAYGMSIHFTDHRKVPNGQTRMKWVQMRFPREFAETLSAKGRLVSSLADGLNLLEENDRLRDETEQMRAFIEKKGLAKAYAKRNQK